LPSRPVERPWGRDRLPPPFNALAGDGRRIGEIWFEDDATPPPALLIKYLFTSERLSIQVHPDDAAARASGLRSGKDEAWLVIDADPGAVIGLGLNKTIESDQLRAAALDGSIEQLIDWRPVKAGDFFYSPAGTIHAIGAGVSLVEIQQNADVTYRLYDYGRPRDLHLDQAIAVADPGPFLAADSAADLGHGRALLTSGGKFVVERWRPGNPVTFDAGDDEILLMPMRDGLLHQDRVMAGSVWSVRGLSRVQCDDVLVAYPGEVVRNDLWVVR
jgi:mannose-6-phosphate isomerase